CIKIPPVTGLPPTLFLVSTADICRSRCPEIHLIIFPCLSERPFIPVFIAQPIPKARKPDFALIGCPCRRGRPEYCKDAGRLPPLRRRIFLPPGKTCMRRAGMARR